jgi:hypothetical protein
MPSNIGVIPEAPSGLQLNITAEQSKLTGDPGLIQVNPTVEFSPPGQYATGQSIQEEPGYQNVANIRRVQYPDNLDQVHLCSVKLMTKLSEKKIKQKSDSSVLCSSVFTKLLFYCHFKFNLSLF